MEERALMMEIPIRVIVPMVIQVIIVKQEPVKAPGRHAMLTVPRRIVSRELPLEVARPVQHRMVIPRYVWMEKVPARRPVTLTALAPGPPAPPPVRLSAIAPGLGPSLKAAMVWRARQLQTVNLEMMNARLRTSVIILIFQWTSLILQNVIIIG